MVFLTSTGFTNPKVFQIIETSKRKVKSSCIITTAAIPLKDKHPIAIKTYQYLQSKDISIIDFLDIEVEKPKNLYHYDLVFILGGDSSHLFNYIKNSGVDQILLEMIKHKTIVVGASAGAMLLSSGNEYTKEFNEIIGIKEEKSDHYNSEGLHITNHILFPHYDVISSRVDNLESKLKVIEDKYNINITRLNNLDFIYIDDHGKISMIIGY